MGARKKVNMETVEITKIINRIEKGKASPSDLATVRKSLTLLKAAQETLIDGDDVHEEDLKKVGKAVGNRLRVAREKKNLNQEQLEKLSKISQSLLITSPHTPSHSYRPRPKALGLRQKPRMQVS